MATPDLTQLNNFYAHLILKEVAKDEKCTQYKNSWELGDNCSADGYLMVKTLELPDEDQPVVPPNFGHVSKSGGIPLQLIFDDALYTFETFNRQQTRDERKRALKHILAGMKVMATFCRYKKTPPFHSITWAHFGEALMDQTDWYIFLGNHERGGFLFLRLCDNPDENVIHGLPVGENLTKYLYVILVCSNSRGVGSELLRLAESAAIYLRCSRIVLSALPTAAGFYFNNHKFQFMNRNGEVVDVSKYQNTYSTLPRETTDGVYVMDQHALASTPPPGSRQMLLSLTPPESLEPSFQVIAFPRPSRPSRVP